MAYLLKTNCLSIPLLCNHYGILFTENGIDYVLHNTPNTKNKFGGNVIIDSYNDFIKDRILISKETINLNNYQIKEYARKNRHKKWDALMYNCETLKNEIITGFKGTNVLTRIIYVTIFGIILFRIKKRGESP